MPEIFELLIDRSGFGSEKYEVQVGFIFSKAVECGRQLTVQFDGLSRSGNPISTAPSCSFQADTQFLRSHGIINRIMSADVMLFISEKHTAT